MIEEFRKLPSLDVLNECFELSNSSPSGLLWRHRPNSHFSSVLQATKVNSRFAGKHAGVRKTRYWAVRVFDVLHVAHRIVYKMHYKEDPMNSIVDHADGDPSNNEPSNLRTATRAQNSFNSRRPSTNTNGFKGIFPRVNRSGLIRWRAKVVSGGMPYFFGTHDTPEEAHSAYVSGAKLIHGDFHRPG